MLKEAIKKIIRICGYDISRYSVFSEQGAQLISFLKIHDVNIVFDVGANTGQFGMLLRAAGYEKKIISFEPLSTPRERLSLLTVNDPLWILAPQAAIGDQDGEVEVNIAANSVSSSILDMTEVHSKAAPNSIYKSKEKVPLRKLDSFASEYLGTTSNLFIKIDTQGFESVVLRGATDVLSKAVGLQLELSFVELYKGQALFDDVVNYLRAIGFEIWHVAPVFSDPDTGRLLQIDATFFRKH